jgi:methylamine methyltransferase corrinoid protein reductive activase
MVLDDLLRPVLGARVDPSSGEMERVNDTKARGITGTGVVAAVALGLESGLVQPPHINTRDARLHLQDGITFGEKDLREAGKAMGAIRGGHRTLIEEVGIGESEIRTMYLAGASGTYVDPIKAQTVGMVPRVIESTVQVGNTSLKMAYDLLVKEETLDMMQSVADSIASKHIMFAFSKVFEDIYVNEIGYWVEGMPIEMYNSSLSALGHPPLPPIVRPRTTIRIVYSDIPVIGDNGLRIVDNIGVHLTGHFPGCVGCGTCAQECPEGALEVEHCSDGRFLIRIATEFCLGTACKHCEAVCPQGVYVFSDLKIADRTWA